MGSPLRPLVWFGLAVLVLVVGVVVLALVLRRDAGGPERVHFQVEDVVLILHDDGERLLLSHGPAAADHRVVMRGEVFAALADAVGMDGRAALARLRQAGAPAERLLRQREVLVELARRAAAGQVTAGLADLMRLGRQIESDLSLEALYARLVRWSGRSVEIAP